MTKKDYNLDPRLDLIFERIVDIPSKDIWKGWTDEKQLKKWFCPLPWKTTECEIDLRPGGIFRTVMQGPNGENMPGLGCYLEIIKNKKLVWTNALFPDFRPAPSAVSCSDFFFTATILIKTQGKKTKYTAIVRHKDEEGRNKHEEMGFKDGWGAALDQLVSLSKNNFKSI